MSIRWFDNCEEVCAIGDGIAEELFGYDDEILQSADEILECYFDDYLLMGLKS